MGQFKNFVEQAKSVRGYLEIPLDGFGVMADGKPPAVKALQFGNAEWMSTDYDRYRGIPVFKGEMSEDDDWEPEDEQLFLGFLREVVVKSVRFVRNVGDNNETVWEPCHVIVDGDDPYEKDGVVYLPMRFIDIANNVGNIGIAILRDSNYGGRMADIPAERFQEEGKDPNGVSGKKTRRAAARNTAQQAGRSG